MVYDLAIDDMAYEPYCSGWNVTDDAADAACSGWNVTDDAADAAAATTPEFTRRCTTACTTVLRCGLCKCLR